MKIEHIAIWVKNLEEMKNFYIKYFDVKSSELYYNEKTGFKSYFLSFKDGARLEIMTKENLSDKGNSVTLGYAHISISLGSKERVDELTEKFRIDGIKIISEPRATGDGYYESVIADIEGNLIELTI